MNPSFCLWGDAIARLPVRGSTPDWSRATMELFRDYMEQYRSLCGLVDRQWQRTLDSEVCMVNGLPYLQAFSSFLNGPSSWMIDATYSTNQRMVWSDLLAATSAAGARWQGVIDVPSIPQVPGTLVAKVCNLDMPFKSKQRNEQAQALRAHPGIQVSSATSIPLWCIEENFSYWLDTGSDVFTQACAYAWSAACAQTGFGHLLKFQSDAGLAYCGYTSLGDNLTLAAFCQVGRAPRIGTAALTATLDWLRKYPLDENSREVYLSLPRFGEDLTYAAYKGHASNESFKFGALYAHMPAVPARPYFCGDTRKWML